MSFASPDPNYAQRAQVGLETDLTDFRGLRLRVGDRVVYVGRQDMKASLTLGVIERVASDHVMVRPSFSSNPLGQPSGRLVKLTLSRKIARIR